VRFCSGQKIGDLRPAVILSYLYLSYLLPTVAVDLCSELPSSAV